MGTLGKRSEDASDSFVGLLAKALVIDLTNGKDLHDAGWTYIEGLDDLTKATLLDSGIAISNSRGQFRLNVESKGALNSLKQRSHLLKEQLDYALQDARSAFEDIVRAKEAIRIMLAVRVKLVGSREEWSSVILLGWWRMLEASGMPAPVDEILSKGLSPKEWVIMATSSAATLASRIAGKYGRVSKLDDAIGYLKAFGVHDTSTLEPPPPMHPSNVEKVIRVLRWEDMEAAIPESIEKAIGFSWFCYMLWELKGVLPQTTGAAALLSRDLQSTLNQLTGMEAQAFDNLVDQLNERGITWATDLISMPAVI